MRVDEILLPHDNTRPYRSLNTQEAITKLGRSVLPHSPYSPDLASSDFHHFEALKYALCGKRLGSDDEFIAEVKEWLRVQNSNSYEGDTCSCLLLAQSL
jgi:hypothetical protein